MAGTNALRRLIDMRPKARRILVLPDRQSSKAVESGTCIADQKPEGVRQLRLDLLFCDKK